VFAVNVSANVPPVVDAFDAVFRMIAGPAFAGIG
jgi:hypothetical protein